MSNFKAFLAIGTMLLATFLVGGATPASADPTGTTFIIATDNFQASDGVVGVPEGGGVIPFGFSTSIPFSGVTIDSMASTSVPGPFTLGGKDFIEFWLTTDDGGFLSSDPSIDGGFAIDGLNWGPGSPPAVATGVLFVQFDIDGVIVPLDPGNGLGIPVGPHPVTGDDALIFLLDPGTDASSLSFAALLLPTIGAVLPISAGIDPLDINSIHIAVEIMHVPEPATLAMAGMGLCSVLLLRRRKR